jgi:addiction module HigA family antidote
MKTRTKSWTSIETKLFTPAEVAAATRWAAGLPRRRPTTPPGKMLREEFLKPSRLTQVALAARMGVEPATVRALVHGRRPIDGTLASRLARALGTTRAFWTNLQPTHDASSARRRLEEDPRFIRRIKAARASLRAGRGTRREDA